MNTDEMTETLAELAETTRTFRAELTEAKAMAEEAALRAGRLSTSGRDASAETKAAAEFRTFMATGEGLRQKDLTIGTDTSGGHSVPTEIDQMLQNQLVEISPVRTVANVVRTASSDYRKLIGTRGASSGWAAETDARTATTTPEMQAVVPTMGELFAYPAMSRWVFEDSAFNLATWLQENVADEFAVQEGQAFIAGDGVDKPTGFLTGTPVTTADATRAFGTLQYVPTGAAGAFGANTFDNLIDLKNALRPSYRAGAVWMMNSTTSAVVQKVKDSDGRLIWNSNVSAGEPPTLLGFPVVEAEDMPDIAANSLSIAFGNFRRGYLITDRGETTVVRDDVTRPGYVKLYIAKRVGGAIADSNAIKLLKFSAS